MDFSGQSTTFRSTSSGPARLYVRDEPPVSSQRQEPDPSRRDMVDEIEAPVTILENVPGAKEHLEGPARFCGGAFGLASRNTGSPRRIFMLRNRLRASRRRVRLPDRRQGIAGQRVPGRARIHSRCRSHDQEATRQFRQPTLRSFSGRTAGMVAKSTSLRGVSQDRRASTMSEIALKNIRGKIAECFTRYLESRVFLGHPTPTY